MTLDDLDRERRLARNFVTGARILAGDPTVTVTPGDVVDLMRLTQPELFGARRPSSFDGCFGTPAGPSLGPSVRWPDGSMSFAAGPHVPAGVTST